MIADDEVRDNYLEKHRYHKRISTAMDYIQHNIAKNPEQELTLAVVAKVACLSSYHFHKVFKLVVGETLAKYIRRLKLEKSAGIFFYFKNASITEVAMALGFSSSQNLAKAFKGHFNQTPSQIKSLSSKQQLRLLIRKKRKNGNVTVSSDLYANDSSLEYMESQNMSTENTVSETLTNQKPLQKGQQDTSRMKINIIDFPARKVIYQRLIGEYGSGVQAAFAQLQVFVTNKEIVTAEPVVINWDNPEITPADKCRTDVCLTLLSEGVNVSSYNASPYNTELIEAGSHAVIRAILTQHHEYELAWQQLFQQVFEQNYKLADRPCFKIMHLETSDPKNGLFDVSFCVAITPK